MADAGRPLAALPIGSGPRVPEALGPLARALTGVGPAVLPVPADDRAAAERLCAALLPGGPVAPGVALVTATSGTTGTPKGALLPVSALDASADATHARLGGPGTWMLALPAHHVAGIQVLLRGIRAGTDPVVLDVSAGFSPRAFAEAVGRMPSGRRYVSLVPAQLHKLLGADGDPEARAAAASFDAVLVGGAACPAELLARADAAGIRVVRTYGSSETAGGCVYDGVPLDGVRVEIDRDGRIHLGGPTLATGYRGIPGHRAWGRPGWFRTDDAGRLDAGRLTVLGRLDEAISTGGLTVLPQVVEAALADHPAIAACAIVGTPHDRLGEQVTAFVVPKRGAVPPRAADLRAHVVAAGLDATAAPRAVVLLDPDEELPLRGPGKIDRRALRDR